MIRSSSRRKKETLRSVSSTHAIDWTHQCAHSFPQPYHLGDLLFEVVLSDPSTTLARAVGTAGVLIAGGAIDDALGAVISPFSARAIKNASRRAEFREFAVHVNKRIDQVAGSPFQTAATTSPTSGTIPTDSATRLSVES